MFRWIFYRYYSSDMNIYMRNHRGESTFWGDVRHLDPTVIFQSEHMAGLPFGPCSPLIPSRCQYNSKDKNDAPMNFLPVLSVWYRYIRPPISPPVDFLRYNRVFETRVNSDGSWPPAAVRWLDSKQEATRKIPQMHYFSPHVLPGPTQRQDQDRREGLCFSLGTSTISHNLRQVSCPGHFSRPRTPARVRSRWRGAQYFQSRLRRWVCWIGHRPYIHGFPFRIRQISTAADWLRTGPTGLPQKAEAALSQTTKCTADSSRGPKRAHQ